MLQPRVLLLQLHVQQGLQVDAVHDGSVYTMMLLHCRGRLYVQLGVPSQGPAMAPGSVKVRPTGDVRGNGAYATRTIPAGSFIIQYEGEWLEWPQFESR